MPPAMTSWASQQLKRINGKDDLTLLEFCMSLTDASEIRQYLAAYLGSTPEVRYARYGIFLDTRSVADCFLCFLFPVTGLRDASPTLCAVLVCWRGGGGVRVFARGGYRKTHWGKLAIVGLIRHWFSSPPRAVGVGAGTTGSSVISTKALGF